MASGSKEKQSDVEVDDSQGRFDKPTLIKASLEATNLLSELSMTLATLLVSLQLNHCLFLLSCLCSIWIGRGREGKS